jgi:hypothetical protein
VRGQPPQQALEAISTPLTEPLPVPDAVPVESVDADFYDNLDYEAQESVRVRYENICFLL